jgi:hypothetical protein
MSRQPGKLKLNKFPPMTVEDRVKLADALHEVEVRLRKGVYPIETALGLLGQITNMTKVDPLLHQAEQIAKSLDEHSTEYFDLYLKLFQASRKQRYELECRVALQYRKRLGFSHNIGEWFQRALALFDATLNWDDYRLADRLAIGETVGGTDPLQKIELSIRLEVHQIRRAVNEATAVRYLKEEIEKILVQEGESDPVAYTLAREAIRLKKNFPAFQLLTHMEHPGFEEPIVRAQLKMHGYDGMEYTNDQLAIARHGVYRILKASDHKYHQDALLAVASLAVITEEDHDIEFALDNVPIYDSGDTDSPFIEGEPFECYPEFAEMMWWLAWHNKPDGSIDMQHAPVQRFFKIAGPLRSLVNHYRGHGYEQGKSGAEKRVLEYPAGTVLDFDRIGTLREAKGKAYLDLWVKNVRQFAEDWPHVLERIYWLILNDKSIKDPERAMRLCDLYALGQVK